MKAWLACLVLACSGCANAPPGPTSMEIASTPQLTVMDGYPEGFAGCSCSFAKNREDFRKRKFIYLESYGKVDSTKNFCMLSLNGDTVRWPRAERPDAFDFDLRYATERNTDQEVREIEGSLSLRFTDGALVESPIFGVCGC